MKILDNDDDTMSIRLSLNIRYGYEIPAVCAQVQSKVKNAIENMTGMNVKEVDIRIATVSVPENK